MFSCTVKQKFCNTELNLHINLCASLKTLEIDTKHKRQQSLSHPVHKNYTKSRSTHTWCVCGKREWGASASRVAERAPARAPAPTCWCRQRTPAATEPCSPPKSDGPLSGASEWVRDSRVPGDEYTLRTGPPALGPMGGAAARRGGGGASQGMDGWLTCPLPVVAPTHRYEQVKQVSESAPSASNQDDYEEDLEPLFTKGWLGGKLLKWECFFVIWWLDWWNHCKFNVSVSCTAINILTANRGKFN